MTDQMGGKRRYATNTAPPVAAIVIGSADVMVSKAEEAIGLAASITLVLCFATSAAVCNQNCYMSFTVTTIQVNPALQMNIYDQRRHFRSHFLYCKNIVHCGFLKFVACQ